MTQSAAHRIRWGRAVIVGGLAVAIGLAGWLRFGYERTPDPQRITVVATTPDVAFVLERNPGDRVAGYELRGDGFELRDDGLWEATTEGASITYSGSVGSRALLRFSTGPAEGRALVRTDAGPVARVDLSSTEEGVEVVALDTPVRVQPANLLLLALALVLAALIAALVVRVVEVLARRFGVGRTVGLLVGVLVLSGLVVQWWPPAPRVLVTDVSVTQPGRAAGEVGVALHRSGGVPRTAFADYFGGPGWEQEGGRSVSNMPGAVTRWSGMVSPDDTLELSSTGSARSLDVEVDGRTRQVVLDAGRAAVSFDDLGAVRGTANRLARAGSTIGDVLLAAIVLLLAGAGAVLAWRWVQGEWRTAAPHPSAGGDASWRLTLELAAVPLLGWLVLLVVFWPGPMNPDAMSQWFQVQDGVLADWHPYLLALLFDGTRHVVDSPWLPILMVALTAALLVGRVGAWSVARGRSVRSAVGWSLLVIVVPATALHTVTLWKDSFYGIGLLGLVVCLWRIEDTRGTWLLRTRNLVLLGAAAAGTWLVRHNGWPVVLGALVIVAVAYRSWWRRLLVVAIAVVTLVAFVQVPLARLLDVGPDPVDDIVMMQHISMHVQRGTDLTSSERRFLEKIRPLDQPYPYDCNSIQATWSGPDVIPLDRYTDHGSELRSLAIRLALRDPRGELDHLICSSKLVWQPWSKGTTTYFMEWYDNGGRIDYLPPWPNRTPLEEPGNAGLAVAVFRAVDHAPDWIVRPALYLWILVAAIVVAVRRTRSWAALRIASPALIQSVTLALVTLVQDVRFQYGVVLIALVLAPLYFTARRDPDDGGPPLVWAGWPRARPEVMSGDAE